MKRGPFGGTATALLGDGRKSQQCKAGPSPAPASLLCTGSRQESTLDPVQQAAPQQPRGVQPGWTG
eukprot:CAMPEP_0195149954 /NCGR_PEP_ID=MMETSP0448-20130528/177988_1 /TAXON_ID=66468 /ORGANISM="Heterocapsa triquestra, Strain CCMP 448" /LENGTH=65 /DNA_ID=CAMNT_0040188621 /DNA_START=32 /DNA_END=225 /DNA_ORIENTATION=-